MDWEDLRHFLAVARAGTVSKAAKDLGSSPSTVIKRVRDLEDTLGELLFDRSRDGYALTNFGQSVLDYAEAAETSTLAITRLAGGNADLASGSVRIAAPELIGGRWLVPLLRQLHEKHPNLMLELVTSMEIVSLSRREAEVSLRFARPEQDDLVARRVATVAFGVYARASDNSARAAWVGFDESMQDLLIAQALKLRMEDDTPVLRTNQISVQLEAARGGIGKALLPCFVADRDPLLARLPDPHPPFALELWLVVRHDLQRSPHVRAVMEFIIAAAQADRHRFEAIVEPTQ